MIPGTLLLAIGFAFKVAVVPFHMWTPDVYEGAPTPVTAFMATAVKTAAFVAFLRVFVIGFGDLHEQWWTILWWLAAITMVIGNVLAVVQSNIKRMLAYSSIAHGGYLLVALVAANDSSIAALLFYLLFYTIMTIGAFAVLVTVSNQTERYNRIDDFAALGWRRPATGILMTIFLLALAGFPGTAGFIAKYQLLLGAAEAELWFLAVLLVLTTAISYWYYLRVAWKMWMTEDNERTRAMSPAEAPLATQVVLIASAGLILLAGIFPDSVLGLALGSVEGLRQMLTSAALTP